MRGRSRALLVALLAAFAPTLGAQVKGPPEFAAQVAAVYVDAFVTRGGRPVADLAASQFELRDNGVAQRLELISSASRPLSAVMVFDTSSSMAGERLRALRAAGEAFLDGLRPADRAGLVAFNHDVFWLAEPTADKAAVRRPLSRLRAGGMTSVFDALYAAILLSAGELPPLVVLFTDGEDNSSWLDAADVRLFAERSNALVHVVAWRPPQVSEAQTARMNAQERLLRDIAEAAGGRFWNADSPDRLRRAFGEIADAIGHRYVLRYEPTGVQRRGWHAIGLRLRVKGEVHSRRGYWVGP